MTFYEQLILVAVPILLPILIGMITVWVHAAIQKLPPNKQAFVSGIVNTAVTSAEQQYGNSVSGDAKRIEATQKISDVLAHYNMKVPPQVVDDLLESAVYALKQTQTGATIVSTSLPLQNQPPSPPSG